MSRSDAYRWQDWRANRGRPLLPPRTCRCGVEFTPSIHSQALCETCAEAAAELDRELLRADPALARAEGTEYLARLRHQLGLPDVVERVEASVTAPVLSRATKRRLARQGRA